MEPTNETTTDPVTINLVGSTHGPDVFYVVDQFGADSDGHDDFVAVRFGDVWVHLGPEQADELAARLRTAIVGEGQR